MPLPTATLAQSRFITLLSLNLSLTINTLLSNAIGAYGGSYCVYRALAVAIGDLTPNHRPNFHLTEPAFPIGPHPQWGDPTKIVSIDPFGHVTTNVFKRYLEAGTDVRLVAEK